MNNSGSAKKLSIAIDGPAGAGKSTTARMLAAELGYVYVDSGAMYRAVAWSCAEHGIPATEHARVSRVAAELEIAFAPDPHAHGEQRVLAGGVDITRVIRTPEIADLASTVSTIPEVREYLVAKQRSFGEVGGIVMEGRDIGTVVLPRAEVKIFLTASLEERANRRYRELLTRGATGTTLEQVQADIAERDRRDTTRAVSPLAAAADSVTIDSDAMDARDVVDAIIDICSSRYVSS